ncbi:MAG: site-2 protease family protein [Clostridiales bacterium]|nr:site-2 protease family protein [Candidatus Coliplasma equi]
MLFQILRSGGTLGQKILSLLLLIISVVPALVLHEYAHGYAAYKLGDKTAKADGRLSLNPLNHLDPIGTLMLLIVGFGWAKPVPVITRNFKKPRRDLAIVAAAGPLMNFLVAFAAMMLYMLTAILGYKFLGPVYANNVTVSIICEIFLNLAYLSVGLGLFNLIPLPPLDGSNILMCLLPPRAAAKYSNIRYYTRYIFLGLIVLSWLPYPISLVGDYIWMPLTWLQRNIISGFSDFWGMIFEAILL